jgi:hypothetical protein
MRKDGFINFYCSRQEYYTARRERTLSDYIRKTKREFEYVGFYLAGATDRNRIDDALRDILRRGCIVKLVLLNPDADAQTIAIVERNLAIAANTLHGTLVHAFEHLNGFRNSLSAEDQSRFHLLRHSIPLTSSAMFVDFNEVGGRLLVDTKIYGAGRDSSYGMEFETPVEDSSLGGQLAASFRRVSESAVVN